MPAQRSIRNRRVRKSLLSEIELPLTSMMDVLIILLVFLLKSYSAATNSFSTVPGMRLPLSGSPDVPPDSLQVIVTPEAITFDNERILDFDVRDVGSADEAAYEFKGQDLDEGGRRIIPLYDALMKAKDRAEILETKYAPRLPNGKPQPFVGYLAIQADRRVRYDTVRRVMYTAGAAGYKVFRFLAMKRDGG